MAIPYMLRQAYKTLRREFAEDVTITRVTSESLDTHDVVSQATSSSTQKAIPYSLISEWGAQDVGEMTEGDAIFMFDHNITIAKRDLIVHNSNTYKVKRIEIYRPRGTLVCKVAYADLQ